MKKTIIETDRAFLLYMDPSHVDFMIEMFQMNKQDLLKIIQTHINLHQNKGLPTFSIFDKKSGYYLGYCGCKEVELKGNVETELTWSIYKEYKEDNIDIEVTFAVRNYLFKYTNIQSLFSVISLKDPQLMNVAEAIDMENDYSYLVGFQKYFVYRVNRDSKKFKASFGDGESTSQLTSSLNRGDHSPNPLKNFKRPRPTPK